MRGAGGTPGGVGQFFLGFGMLIGGGYLLLSSIVVTSRFGMGMRLFSLGGGFGITTGMVLIPFIGGVLLVFYDSKNKAGWLLGGGSLLALLFGVISSIHLRLRQMSVFELLTLLVLCFGGLGLMLRSLKSSGDARVDI